MAIDPRMLQAAPINFPGGAMPQFPGGQQAQMPTGQPPVPTAPHPVLPPMPTGMLPGRQPQIPGGPNNPYYEKLMKWQNMKFDPKGEGNFIKAMALMLYKQKAMKEHPAPFNYAPPGVQLPPNPYATGGQ